MDSLITAAARALGRGDPLGALNRIALRDDAPALALRGIAMAQLGDFDRARALLRRAARAFGPREALARARCAVAGAEVALASRDLAAPPQALDVARSVLERHGDFTNAAHARLLAARRLLLIGRLDEAGQALAALDPVSLPPAQRCTRALVEAGLAIRRLQTAAARDALARAAAAAGEARIPALAGEVARAAAILEQPAARLFTQGTARPLRLDEVAALRDADALVVDACRSLVHDRNTTVKLARRPVLFALLRTLAEAWPAAASRETLLARAFNARSADDSHRARLRVEITRLRALLRPLAALDAVPDGFVLVAGPGREVVLVTHPVEERHAAVLALLADGEAWSSSALALALGTGQRRVQRALDSLAGAGKAQTWGRGRARRWTTPPLPGITTTLLLPPPLPGG